MTDGTFRMPLFDDWRISRDPPKWAGTAEFIIRQLVYPEDESVADTP